jgi:hypothetical protein
VDNHWQRPVEEELGRSPPLGRGEQDPLPRRPESQDSVEPGRRQELEIRPEGLLVQGGAIVTQRGDSGGKRSTQHLSD